MPQNPNIPNPQQFEPSMLGGLKKAWQGANTPNWTPSPELTAANQKQTDEAAPFQQEPSLDPNMMLNLLSQQTSGVGLASAALPFAGPALRGAAGIARGTEAAPGALQGLRGATQGARVARGVVPAAETLGEISPEFTAVGGEGMYNASKPAVKAAEPLESVYNKIRGTMGPAKPPLPEPPPALSPFKQMEQAGQFGGDRTTGSFVEGPGGLNTMGALSALRKMR